MIYSRIAASLFVGLACSISLAAEGWVDFKGGDGPGKGMKIVLISGDEEYRSEEAMPMLGQLLSARHGFDCRVVFSMSDDGTTIDPNAGGSLEGIDALNEADLMIIFTRFRHPSDDVMETIDAYIQQGKPVIGLRTSTHAFNGLKGKFAHYNNGHEGGSWQGGFGRAILGEKWINHHGHHGHESTRGIVAPGAEGHPILTGIKPGEIWGTTDVYGVRLPMQDTCRALVLGQVLAGMNPDDAPVDGEKNDPMMPVVWTKAYATDSGRAGTAVATTMGAAEDFVQPGLRRLIVNAVYWQLRMEDQITPELDIEFVKPFAPSKFGFRTPNKFPGYWKEKNLRPADFSLE